MSQDNQLRHPADTAAHYQICLYGRITPECEERLGGMQATVIDAGGKAPQTILTGYLSDQAALSGVLACVYDYGLALISVQRHEETRDI
jgi:hypothetical protein